MLKSEPSASEPTDMLLPAVIAQATDPLAVVAYLSKRRDALAEELGMTEHLLHAAWKLVPADPNILRAPYKSDVAATCRECGESTKWRTGTGFAKCQPACHRQGHRKMAIPQEVWDILEGKIDLSNESLDDD